MTMPSTDCSRCVHQWRSWIRPLSIVFYVVMICIALPVIIVEFQVWGTKLHLQAWFVGGFFALLAIPISVWGIIQHLIHYTQPHLQRHIIRILWMVPIYAINAWFALRFKDAAIYLDTARECYEAYVIYNFMAYLLNYLHSEFPDLAGTLSEKPQQKCLIPICCLPPWKMGDTMINNCKHGVLQYTVIRPLTTIIAFICNFAGKDVYGEGKFSYKNGWTYLVVINNFSQMWAMYCLVLFYHATKEELAPIKPISKFVCVKMVVFMSFWQSVLISILSQAGVLKVNTSVIDFDQDDLANGIQDFCICIEMFLASLAHYYSFSHRPYVDYAQGYVDCCSSFASMWDVSDVREDVVNHVRVVGKNASQIVRRPLGGARREEAAGPDSERTPLLRSGSESDDHGALSPPPAALRDQGFEHLSREQELRQAADYQPVEGAADTTSINTLEGSTDFLRRSTTSSMNNFITFSDSGEAAPLEGTTGPEEGAPVEGAPIEGAIWPVEGAMIEDAAMEGGTVPEVGSPAPMKGATGHTGAVLSDPGLAESGATEEGLVPQGGPPYRDCTEPENPRLSVDT